MKIGQTTDALRNGPLSGTVDGRLPASAPGTPVEAVQPGERVELSAASRRLAGAAGNGEAEVRSEKVEEIRRAIQEGRFHVSANAVADRMIAEAAELIESIALGGER